MTFAPEGKCQSNFVGGDKEATVAGNWFFSNRWLVVTITGKSERNTLARLHISASSAGCWPFGYGGRRPNKHLQPEVILAVSIVIRNSKNK